MLMYMTFDNSPTEIEPVIADKATASTVWVNGYRHSRSGSNMKFHESWSDARNNLLSVAQSRLLAAKTAKSRAESTIAELKRMKQPEQP